MFHRAVAVAAIALGMSMTAASAAELSRAAIEAATFEAGDAQPPADQLSPLGFKLQVLLDRTRASPGIIDGYFGKNVEVALRTFQEAAGLEPTGQLDEETWRRLGGRDARVLMEYQISERDVQGPFVEAIPDSFEEMAEMDHLSYTGPAELLAERFHMHMDALEALNPDADFNEPGTRLVVAMVRGEPPDVTVVRIEVDKEMEQVRGYDRHDRLIVAYPATIGSTENPSPSGTHAVKAVVRDPNYTYQPHLDIDGPEEALILPPGPNGPVGSIWIDLDEQGYGIHGTPDPAQIRRDVSHGCVRLTNWDAAELADLVEEGTIVEFLEGAAL